MPRMRTAKGALLTMRSTSKDPAEKHLEGQEMGTAEQKTLERSVSEQKTDLAQANRELTESVERLERAQSIAHIGNWEWNITTGDLVWSDEIYRLFGRSPQEFEPTYEAFLEAIHPDDRQQVADAVNQTVEHDSPYNVTHRIVTPDGAEKWCRKGEVFFAIQMERPFAWMAQCRMLPRSGYPKRP